MRKGVICDLVSGCRAHLYFDVNPGIDHRRGGKSTKSQSEDRSAQAALATDMVCNRAGICCRSHRTESWGLLLFPSEKLELRRLKVQVPRG